MTLKLQTDEVCCSFQLRRNGGTYIRSVVRTAIVASVVEPRSSAALRSAEFSRIIGNINATLLPALVGLSLGSLTTFVSALGLAALFGLPDVMRVSISAPGSSRSAPAAVRRSTTSRAVPENGPLCHLCSVKREASGFIPSRRLRY